MEEIIKDNIIGILQYSNNVWVQKLSHKTEFGKMEFVFQGDLNSKITYAQQKSYLIAINNLSKFLYIACKYLDVHYNIEQLKGLDFTTLYFDVAGKIGVLGECTEFIEHGFVFVFSNSGEFLEFGEQDIII